FSLPSCWRRMIAKKSSGVALALGVSAVGIELRYYSAPPFVRKPRADFRQSSCYFGDRARGIALRRLLLLLRQALLRRGSIKCDVNFQYVYSGIPPESEKWFICRLRYSRFHDLFTDPACLGYPEHLKLRVLQAYVRIQTAPRCSHRICRNRRLIGQTVFLPVLSDIGLNSIHQLLRSGSQI